MSIVINLTAGEEARLSDTARQADLAPEAFAEKLVREHLLGHVPSGDELDAKLRRRQEADGTPLMPDASTAEMFAEWAEEDTRVTPEERAENDRVYAEIEKNGIPRTQV